MFTKLVLLFLISFLYLKPAFSQDISQEKLRELAFSPSWLNLYYYNEKHKEYYSDALGEKFFFSEKGRNSPLEELKAALEAFKDLNKKWGYINKIAQCAFPARYHFVKTSLPGVFKDQVCQDFLEWKNAIAAKKVYLVYAGAYPNNPASMFGHTFLRFSRGEKNEKHEGSYLLNYSIGFLAHTNNTDDAVTYTIKGITGGYDGHFEIKPFYLNLGIYNNSESRDLWEYEVDLSQSEVDYLLKHIWEIGHNTGFPYFFFLKNCSYYMLRLLEVVKPQWKMHDDFYFFASPLQTIKSFKKYNKKNSIGFHPSIKRRLFWKLSRLNENQRLKYREAKSNLEGLSRVNNSLILETLLTYWDYMNYKNNTELSEGDRELRKETLERRADIQNSEGFYDDEKKHSWQSDTSGAPHLGHPPHRLSFSYDKKNDFLNFELAYGFHRFFDNTRGYEDYAFIDAMGIKGSLNLETSQFKINKVNLLEILSLFPFSLNMPSLSWNISLFWSDENIIRNEKTSTFHLMGGVGFSQKAFYNKLQLYLLLSPVINLSFKKSYHNLSLGLSGGFKLYKNLSYSALSFYKNSRVNFKHVFRYYHFLNRRNTLFIKYKLFDNLSFAEELALGYQLYF